MATPKFAFVSYDLDFSIVAAQKLWDNRRDAPASNFEVAQLLDYTSTNNGAFLTRIANAKAFGLIEGPSTQLKVTPLAKTILHPESDDQATATRIAAFENVPLFKAFLARYNGQVLPNAAGLTNILESVYFIKHDKCAFVLKRLLDSAEQAGLFRMAGDRSKMIRPTFTGQVVPPAPGVTPPEELDHGAAERAAAELARQAQDRNSARSSKMIDGVLDELPPKGQWTEADLSQWLTFFEGALRVFYKLPKPAGKAKETL